MQYILGRNSVIQKNLYFIRFSKIESRITIDLINSTVMINENYAAYLKNLLIQYY